METLNPVKTPLTKKMDTVAATECANCGTTTTPLWRRGPNGETICNACGLYLKARNTLRPPTLKKSNKKEKNDCGGGTCPGGGQCDGTGGSTSCAGCPAFNQHQVNRQTLMCANCRTTTTPLWRRDEAGNTICNACGLYYKLHNVHRPVSMKRSVIKRRKRITIAQGSDEEETGDSESVDSENEPKTCSVIPEIEDFVIKKKTVPTEPMMDYTVKDHREPIMSHETSPSLLPPISSERQSYLGSFFNGESNMLPPLSLPPLTSPSQQTYSLSPPSVHEPILTSLKPKYELADFDTALDKLEHLRRQVRPDQAFALSELTHALTHLATRAESAMSLDTLVYRQ